MNRFSDECVLGSKIFINRNGLRWCHAPKEYGPAKTLYNRWKRWSDNGVFARIMVGLAAERAEHKTIRIDATYLKAQRTASSLCVKKGARAADRGHDADWFRKGLKDKGLKVCIPGRKSRKKAVKYDKRRYKRRNRIEILFGPLKDWRRVATRYDRCPETFFSAVILAATVLFWL